MSIKTKKKPRPAPPPQTLEALQSVVGESANGVGVPLGQKGLAALMKMIETPHRTAVLSIVEIARDNDINPSTLTRVCQRLGFHGFSEMQELFCNHITEVGGGYYSSQTLQLLETCEDAASGFAVDLAKGEVKNVMAAASRLDKATIMKAADILAAGRRVYVLGLRGSFPIAHFFGYYLGFLQRDAFVLGGAGFSIAEDLSRLTSSDALVVISFRPYTNVTVAACKSARARDVPVVAITDAFSPIAQDSENSVTLSALSPYYFNAALANFFLAQALLTALAQKLGSNIVSELNGLESQFLELDVEFDPGASRGKAS